MQRTSGDLSLIVEDNGPGFDAEEARKRGAGKRLGLFGMRERAGLLGGTLTLESQPGQGTAIFVRLPLSEEDGSQYD